MLKKWRWRRNSVQLDDWAEEFRGRHWSSYMRRSADCCLSVVNWYCCCLMMSRESLRTCRKINNVNDSRKLLKCPLRRLITRRLPSWCPEAERLHHPTSWQRKRTPSSPPLTSRSDPPPAHHQGGAGSRRGPEPSQTLWRWATGRGSWDQRPAHTGDDAWENENKDL